jgi:phytanoyl-CoA hydroxylase
MTFDIPSAPLHVSIMSIRDAASDLGHDEYATNGAIIVPNVFSAEEMAIMGTVFTDMVENNTGFAKIDHHIHRDDVLSRYHRLVQPHRYPDTEVGALAMKYMFDDRLHSIASSLLGPLYGAQSMVHFKPPGARGQAMHQDNYFLQTHPESCMAAWIAIDDADEENGAIKVVPGTHKIPVICHEQADQTVSYASMGLALPQGAPVVLASLKSGDVLFFHGSMLHGSDPNVSKRFRRCLIYHYVPQDSKKISEFFQPLVVPSGGEIGIEVEPNGGPCGIGKVANPFAVPTAAP